MNVKSLAWWTEKSNAISVSPIGSFMMGESKNQGPHSPVMFHSFHYNCTGLHHPESMAVT